MKKAIALTLLLSLSSLALGQEAPAPDAEVRRLIEDLDPNYKQINAAKALAKLGPRAAPAVPSLIHTLGTTKDTRLAQASVEALGAIGPGARAALPQLHMVTRFHIGDLATAAKKAIEAIEGSPIRISPERVEPANEGKVVVLEGPLEAQRELRDAEFGVATKGVSLRRVVEHYQWVELKKTVGKRRNKRTTYSYVKRWDQQLYMSDQFRVKAGHLNPWSGHSFEAVPPKRWKSTPWIGSFELSGYRSLAELQPLPLPATAKQVRLGVSLEGRSMTWVPAGDAFYASPADPKNPKVGDHRIRFLASSPAKVVVRGAQRGNLIHVR
jgi:transmembrane protein TMEM43